MADPRGHDPSPDQSVTQTEATNSLFMEHGSPNCSASASAVPSTTIAAAEKPSTHIAQLPAELKCQVAGYVPSLKDLKSLSLVDRTWASVAIPLIWEMFYADQTLSPRRQMRALTDPSSNIIKFVKHIVSARHLDGKYALALNCLPLLLARVAHGQILRFSSCGDDDSFYCFTALLQTHRIQELRITARSWNKLASGLRDVISLEHVKRLKIDLRCATKYRAYFDLQKLLTRCNQLEDLDFVGLFSSDAQYSTIDFTQEWYRGNEKAYRYSGVSRKRVDNRFDDTEMLHEEVFLEGQKLLEVHKLQFRNLRLLATQPLMQRLNVHELCVLTLVNMPMFESPSILEVLSATFNGAETRLHTFSMIRIHSDHFPSGESTRFTKSLQMFLLSFQGLKKLHVEYNALDRLEIGCVAHHGETLQELLFVNGSISRRDQDVSVSVTDLAQLAHACPVLQFLCLNLYELDVDDTTSHLPSPHAVYHTPTDFAQALLALCAMQKLCVLRFTNPPNYRKSLTGRPQQLTYNAEFAATLKEGLICRDFQARANEMMAYLKHHGSNIELLAFAPYEPMPDLPDLDEPVSWPNYLYTPVHSVDEGGHDVMRAQASGDWAGALCDTSILEDIGKHVSSTFAVRVLEFKDECSYFFRGQGV